MEYNIENHLIFLNGGSNKIWFLFELEPGPRWRWSSQSHAVWTGRPDDEFYYWTIQLLCPELVFSCSIVVRRVLEVVLDHNNFLVVPSITKGVVLVKLPDKSDAACLHRHVHEWKYCSIRFSKVDEMVMVQVDISHEVHCLVSYAGFIPWVGGKK